MVSVRGYNLNMNDIYLIIRRTHKEAIAHARASGLNVLLQFHSAESAGTSLRSERNPAYAFKLTFAVWRQTKVDGVLM